IIPFNAALRPLLYELRDQASNGGPLKKFSCGYTAGPDFTNIYALVQCTPDLSKQECYGCLEDLFNQIPKYLTGKVGGRIVVHMCNLQYDMKLFFNVSGIALVIPPPPGIDNMEKEKYNTNCDNSNCHSDSHWCHNDFFTLYLDKIEDERDEAM
nr:cysteine-rich RLK (receptor-like protein kinase) 26 [Tanacetum cinerariifolium]